MCRRDRDISVRRSTIERVMLNFGKIIAVGTTSVRTLESLYYIGVTLATHPDATSEELVVRQWMPYEDANNRLTPVSYTHLDVYKRQLLGYFFVPLYNRYKLRLLL